MRTILAKAGRILLPVMDGDASYIVHRPDHWIYKGTVFAATTDWSHGLQGNDAHVVRITKNVLERLGR